MVYVLPDPVCVKTEDVYRQAKRAVIGGVLRCSLHATFIVNQGQGVLTPRRTCIASREDGNCRY